MADTRCNGAKSSSLAAAEHVAHWGRRVVQGSPEDAQLQVLTAKAGWWRHPDRTLGAARGIYLRLPADAKLWRQGNEFVGPDHRAIAMALSVTPP